jgi:hypothetical protein
MAGNCTRDVPDHYPGGPERVPAPAPEHISHGSPLTGSTSTNTYSPQPCPLGARRTIADRDAARLRKPSRMTKPCGWDDGGVSESVAAGRGNRGAVTEAAWPLGMAIARLQPDRSPWTRRRPERNVGSIRTSVSRRPSTNGCRHVALTVSAMSGSVTTSARPTASTLHPERSAS